MSEGDMEKNLEEQFSAWLKACPPKFPEYIDLEKRGSVIFNPIIGGNYQETHQNILHLLEALKTFFVPGYGEGFSLNEDAAFGLADMLECITRALRFEEQRYEPE